MKTGTLIITLLFSTATFASGVEREKSAAESSWTIGTRTVDAKLPGRDARIKFTFSHFEKGLSGQTVMLQYGNTKKSVKSNVKGTYALALKPGKYTFTISQIGCDTLVADLEIKKQERVDVTVNFAKYVAPTAEADKPVISLYPTKPTEVEVLVNTGNALTFTYPEYKDGWKVMANPDGTINTNNQTYDNSKYARRTSRVFSIWV